jgi:hypothetical protein
MPRVGARPPRMLHCGTTATPTVRSGHGADIKQSGSASWLLLGASDGRSGSPSQRYPIRSAPCHKLPLTVRYLLLLFAPAARTEYQWQYGPTGTPSPSYTRVSFQQVRVRPVLRPSNEVEVAVSAPSRCFFLPRPASAVDTENATITARAAMATRAL